MKKNFKEILLACPIPSVVLPLPYTDYHTFRNDETYSMAPDIDLAQNSHCQFSQFASIVSATLRLREEKVPVTFLGDF